MNKFLITLAFLLLTNVSYAAAPKVGDKAPDFTVTSLSGEKLTLSSLKGKTVLVGMFHICVPCMNQALEFEKIRQQMKRDDLVIIGINTDGDSKKDVTEYLSKFPSPIQFTYYLDPETSVHKAYIQRDMPTVLIIDKEGIIKSRTSSMNADQLVKILNKVF